MYASKNELDDIAKMIVDCVGQDQYNKLADTTKKLTILDAINTQETTDDSVIAYYIYKQSDAVLPLHEIRNTYQEYKPILQGAGLINDGRITDKGLAMLRSQLNIMEVHDVFV